jgi:hypothetical protein
MIFLEDSNLGARFETEIAIKFAIGVYILKVNKIIPN